MYGNSELGKLLQDIENETRAAWNGMNGLSQGVSKHQFITARYDKLEQLHSELAKLVGPDKATDIITTSLDQGAR